MKSCKNILVAIDTSNEAKQVLAAATELGRCFDAKLSLIHVVEPVVTDSSYDLINTVPLEMDDVLVKHAEDFLANLKRDLAPDTDISSSVELGSVKTEILRHARENSIDLIVVGSHGRHGLALLLGSTANALLHGAPCDVYVVRIKD
ncbi:Universal stress protein family COG0589 [hydrothermal vent metagenome]|uniref:Universal stress protein family COG0589 n=1 Tax=hydrothermal vent metagenome TaxID=652676 RepID=A0A3B1BL33_9ZZZZ